VTKHPARVLAWIVGTVVAAIAATVSSGLWSVASRSPRLLHWDPAAHGFDGVQMAEALRRHDAAGFLRLVGECRIWPPLFPVLEAPVFLAFGDDYRVATGMMPLLFGVAVLAAYLAGLALGGFRGIVTGSLSAALVAASPYARQLGMTPMFEVPGMLLLLLAIAFYIRQVSSGRMSDAILCSVATFLLFMLKYNYALLWLVPLVLNEMGRTLPPVAELGRSALRTLRRPRGLLALGIAGGAVALIAFLAHADGVARLAGRTFRVPGPVPVGVAMAAIVAMIAVFRARSLWNAWKALRPEARVFAAIVVLPCGLWLADPARLKGFLQFIVNRSSNLEPLGSENLLYYPRVFVAWYTVPAAFGIVILALGLAGILLLVRPMPRGQRIIPLALAVDVALVLAHPYKGWRYLFPVAPLIWMSAALVIALAFERLSRAWPGRARTGLAAAVAGLALLLVVIGPDPTAIRRDFDGFTSPPSVRRVLDAIVEVNTRSRGTMLFGTWNRLSTPLCEWHQSLAGGDAAKTPRPKNPLWYVDTRAAALLDRLASDRQVERVIVLTLRPGFPATPSKEEASGPDIESPWYPEFRVTLARDRRFLLEEDRNFDDSGYVLRVYRKRG